MRIRERGTKAYWREALHMKDLLFCVYLKVSILTPLCVLKVPLPCGSTTISGSEKLGTEKVDFKIGSNMRIIRVQTTPHNNNFVDKYKVKRTAFDWWCECNRKLNRENDRTCTVTSDNSAISPCSCTIRRKFPSS